MDGVTNNLNPSVYSRYLKNNYYKSKNSDNECIVL
jgi:hypothetical protein